MLHSLIIRKISKQPRLKEFLSIELRIKGMEVKTFIPLTFEFQLGVLLAIVNKYGLNLVVHDLGFKIYHIETQGIAYESLGAYLWMNDIVIVEEYKEKMEINEETGTGELESKRKPLMNMWQRAIYRAFLIINFEPEKIELCKRE